MSTENLERLAAGVLLAGFRGRSVPDETHALIARGVRNFVLFARNAGSQEHVQTLTAALRGLAGEDAIVAVDHEGGRVNRLQEAVPAWPSPMAWAAADDIGLVQRASEVMARELSALGFTLNLAPVADILSDYRNPVLSNRCFSDDPVMTSRLVGAFIAGHRDGGVATSAKHFPGHGGTPTDSHVDLPHVSHSLDRLRTRDMLPFVAAVNAGVTSLMISHAWYSGIDAVEIPGTVSHTIPDLARTALGFDGPIVTDSMEMGAVMTRMGIREAGVRAVLAGCDLVVVSHSAAQQTDVLDGLIEAVDNGSLPLSRLQEANDRIDRLRPWAVVTGSPLPTAGPDTAEEIARCAVTLVRDRLHFIPLEAVAETAIGVVTFARNGATQVENVFTPPSALAQAVRAVHRNVIDVVASDERGALDRMREVDTVIVGTTMSAGRHEQSETVRELLDAGKKVIVAGLRDPFDLLSFPDAPCFLVAYDDSPVTTAAATSVIFGRSVAEGRLPVAIPGLYERGHRIHKIETPRA
ncbi:MAG: beta-N-acetylhexosaminidase [Chloroflexota bacterium]